MSHGLLVLWEEVGGKAAERLFNNTRELGGTGAGTGALVKGLRLSAAW